MALGPALKPPPIRPRPAPPLPAPRPPPPGLCPPTPPSPLFPFIGGSSCILPRVPFGILRPARHGPPFVEQGRCQGGPDDPVFCKLQKKREKTISDHGRTRCMSRGRATFEAPQGCRVKTLRVDMENENAAYWRGRAPSRPSSVVYPGKHTTERSCLLSRRRRSQSTDGGRSTPAAATRPRPGFRPVCPGHLRPRRSFLL